MDNLLTRHEFGFLTLVSPPTERELAEYYAQEYYQSEKSNYRKSYPPDELHAIQLRVRLRAAQADRLRGRNTPGSLLDVGCGEGFVMAAYAEAGWKVTGIDHSKDGVERMNPDQAPNVHQGNLFSLLEDYASQEKRYDLVWLGNVLEHVLDPVGLLEKLHDLVAPDGLLVATVPNDGSEYQEQLMQNGVIKERFWIAVPDHLSYFTRDSLARTAQETGWRVRDIQGDFPIDLFLCHPGSNYVNDRSNGPGAHKARLHLEAVIGKAGEDKANVFYSALAGVGLGRNITAFLSPTAKTKK